MADLLKLPDGLSIDGLEVITDSRVVQNLGYGVQTTVTGSAVHNHNPSTARFLRVVPSASIDWTGISGGWDGRPITITNTATGAQVITIKHNSGSSSAGNTISCPGASDYTLSAGEGVSLWYDGTSTLWRFASSK